MMTEVIPVVLLPKERKAIYRHKGEDSREQMDCAAQRQFISMVESKDGETYHFLIHVSAQRCFESNLRKIEKTQSLGCMFCNGVVDNGEHIFLSYGRWDRIRPQFYVNKGILSQDSALGTTFEFFLLHSIV